MLNLKKYFFYLIWNKIPAGIHGTKIVFFGFFGILISDSESAKNLELGGRLNGPDPNFGHWDAYWFKMTFLVFSRILAILIPKNISYMTNSMVLNSKFYKSINNWKFWPNLWPVNYQKEINSQNKTSKINIHYWLRIIIENLFRCSLLYSRELYAIMQIAILINYALWKVLYFCLAI